ncbi:uncharacterized protein LOC131955235 [Physella acuta]|uniref:uncharacterized protein LOC131955235 n=1 Tax=Physella acuta TaxID=109671 RepID=UPI0027DCF71D|nr:uncharacterized protein LOC131955235 [Physella acuta]
MTHNLSQANITAYLNQLQRETTLLMIPSLIFLIGLAVVGLIGNSLVLFVYLRKFTKTAVGVFIVTMAVSDLLTCAVLIPGDVYDLFHQWDYDQRLLCQMRMFAYAATHAVASLALIAVAVTRYLKICRPFGRQVTITHARVSCVIMTVLSLLYSTPYALVHGIQTRNTTLEGVQGHYCAFDDEYVATTWPRVNSGIFILAFVSVSTPLVTLYGLIWVKARHHSNRRVATGGVTKGDNSLKRDNSINKKPFVGKVSESENSRWSSSSDINQLKQETELNLNKPSTTMERECVKRLTYPYTAPDSSRSTILESKLMSLPRGCRILSTLDTARHTTNRKSDNPGNENNTSVIQKLVITEEPSSLSTKSITSTTNDSLGNQSNSNNEHKVASGLLCSKLEDVPSPSRRKNPFCRHSDLESTSHQTQSITETEENSISESYITAESSNSDTEISSESVMLRKLGLANHVNLACKPQESKSRPGSKNITNFKKEECPKRKPRGIGKATCMLLTISLLFILGLIPFLALDLFRNIFPESYKSLSPVGLSFYHLFLRTYLITVAANPIVYGFCDVKFRKECLKLFKCNT